MNVDIEKVETKIFSPPIGRKGGFSKSTLQMIM